MKKSSRAYALPLVLSILTISTVALVATLDVSVQKFFASRSLSQKQTLEARAVGSFHQAKDIFFSVVSPLITGSEVGNEPDLNLHQLVLGDLPNSIADLIPNTEFNPDLNPASVQEHAILQHGRWATMKHSSSKSDRFDDVQVALRCVGETSLAGEFLSGVCTRSNTRFPKIFEMVMTVRDTSDLSIYTTVRGELSVAPLNLNDFSTVLTNANHVSFGNGLIEGNVSISGPGYVNFLNSGELRFADGFAVDDPEKLGFGCAKSMNPNCTVDPTSNYQPPHFARGVSYSPVDARNLFDNFENVLANQSSSLMVDISQSTGPFNPDPGDTLISTPHIQQNILRFGENCSVEVAHQVTALVKNQSLGSEVSCVAVNPSQQTEPTSVMSSVMFGGSSGAPSGQGSADVYYVPKAAENSSSAGNYQCLCNGPGAASCTRTVSKEVVSRPLGPIEDKTLIYNNNGRETVVQPSDSNLRKIEYCGEKSFSLISASGDIELRSSFVQAGIQDPQTRVAAAFITLGDSDQVIIPENARVLENTLGKNTLKDVQQTGGSIVFGPDETSFQLHATLAAIGEESRIELAESLLLLDGSIGDVQYGRFEHVGGLISTDAPNFRSLKTDGSVRAGFGRVDREFRANAGSPGINQAISSQLEIAINRLSISSTAWDEAVHIAGFNNSNLPEFPEP